MREKSYQIGITGFYGGMNLGDEAILETIVRQLKDAIPSIHITVFTKNCEDTLARHRAVDHAVTIQDLIRQESRSEIETLDLLIFGGGILYDRDVKLYLREIELVAGRCISGTHEAFSSFRVTPIAMATGQAAGVCAALAVRLNISPRQVPALRVQDELRSQGAILENEIGP